MLQHLFFALVFYKKSQRKKWSNSSKKFPVFYGGEGGAKPNPGEAKEPQSRYKDHRRMIDTEEKTKVVAAVWGTNLNAALAISSKDDENKKKLKDIHIGRVVVFSVCW